MQIEPIGHIHNDYTDKFGIPRQSGLVPELLSTLVFTKTYRNPDVLRGIEGFSHLWLLWEFSESIREHWSATVRPPRLAGNTRMGVFATRSPFRPNPIGLSVVKLEKVELETTKGPILTVSGADMLSGTPILDIKPYLPHVDAIPDALGGFAAGFKDYHLEVCCSQELLAKLPEAKRRTLLKILAQDPRPSYQHDPERVYGVSFAGYNVKFVVADQVLTVIDIAK